MKDSHPPTSSAFADPAADIASLRQRLDEAARLMSAYRVKAHALDRELDATRGRLSKSRASHKAIIAERDATIEDRDITITAICSELAEARKDRASIVAFLAAEAGRFDRSARSASGDFVYDKRALEISCDKLRAQADIIRSLAAQIERGDDRQGGE